MQHCIPVAFYLEKYHWKSFLWQAGKNPTKKGVFLGKKPKHHKSDTAPLMHALIPQTVYLMKDFSFNNSSEVHSASGSL